MTTADRLFEIAAAAFPDNYSRRRPPDRLFVHSTREHLSAMPLPSHVTFHPSMITAQYPALVLERHTAGGAYQARLVDPQSGVLRPVGQSFSLPVQADALRRLLIKHQ